MCRLFGCHYISIKSNLQLYNIRILIPYFKLMKRQAESQNNDVKPDFGDYSEQHLPPLKLQPKYSQPGNIKFKKTFSNVSVGSNRFGKHKLPDVVAQQIMRKAHQNAEFRNSKEGMKMSSGIRNTGKPSYNISSLFKTQSKVVDQKKQQKYQMDNVRQSMPPREMQMESAQVTDQIRARIKNRQLKSERKNTKKMNVRIQQKIKKHYEQQIDIKTQICNICALELPEQEFQGVSIKCSHLYCSSCLQQYIIYKINSFQEVQCPNDSCRNILEEDTQAYSELPLDLRKKFRKIKQYEISKQQGKRLCPREQCDGVIDLPQNQTTNPTCGLCTKQFCHKCFFQVHQGACDPYQLNFFQQNLHYRQCNRCKNVIQKISGCNHMTCKCGYQFCYVCSKRWRSGHVCNNPDNQPVNIDNCQCCCFQCQCCNCCNQCIRNDECCNFVCDHCCQPLYECGCCRICQWCCEGDCCENFCDCMGGCCDTICNCNFACCPENCCQTGACKAIKAVPFFLIWLLFLIPVILCAILLLICFWIIVSVVAGLFGYSFMIICDELQGCFVVLAIIFFPITMLAGVVFAFKDIFCQVVSEQVPSMFLIIPNTLRDICEC